MRRTLAHEGYDVLVARDAEAGLKALRKSSPDLVILDIMLPGMDGLEFLRVLRRESELPVILLSAKHSEFDRILGLKLGADDYIVKPFSLGEFLARIAARLRQRERPAKPGALDGLEVDLARHEVRVGGRLVQLSTKEFKLLALFIEADGKVLSREHLLEVLWGYEAGLELDTRTIDQHVARLRGKLGAQGALIVTVPNFGYKLRR